MRHKIETKRLVLRPFADQDLNALVIYAGDIDVARATGQLPHPYTKAEAQSWLDYNHSGASSENHIYAVASQDSQLLGCVSLTHKNGNWELGYWLGQPHWHLGYMREACTALLDEARQSLAPTQLCACVFTDNPRSLTLLQHLGFSLCGLSTDFCVARGHDVKSHQLTLTLEAHHA